MKNIFQEIKNRVEIIDVCDYLSIRLRKKGVEWVGNCPNPGHPDKTASFTVGGKKNPEKFFCFGCQVKGDLFDLMKMMGYNQKDTISILAGLGGIEIAKDETFSGEYRATAPGIPRKRLKEKLEDDHVVLDAELVNEVYQYTLSKLSLTGFAEADLIRRGFEVETAYRLGYRSLPVKIADRIALAEEVAQKFGLDENNKVPGFFQLEKSGKWCFTGNKDGKRQCLFEMEGEKVILAPEGLLVPLRDIAGRIQALKIRTPDFPFNEFGLTNEQYRQYLESQYQKKKLPHDLEPKKRLLEQIAAGVEFYPPKYVIVSSINRKCGVRSNIGLHFSPLNPPDWSSRQFRKPLIITEGELKADLIALKTGNPVISLPGVNLHHDKLTQYFLAPAEAREVLEASERIDQKILVTLEEMKSKASYFDLRTIFSRIPNDPVVLLAMDNEDKLPVRHSLAKLTLLAQRTTGIRWFILLWNDKKGLDDLLSSGWDQNCGLLAL